MSGIPSLPSDLSPALTGRDAIADALYRCVVGLDTNDPALFDSAFTQTASFTINGKKHEGLQAVHAHCYDMVSKLDTSHFVTNPRINITGGDDTASMTASVLSQHFRGGNGMAPEQPRLMAGALYYLDLVRGSDGTWKIEDWKMEATWAEGDWAVMSGN